MVLSMLFCFAKSFVFDKSVSSFSFILMNVYVKIDTICTNKCFNTI